MRKLIVLLVLAVVLGMVAQADAALTTYYAQVWKTNHAQGSTADWNNDAEWNRYYGTHDPDSGGWQSTQWTNWGGSNTPFMVQDTDGAPQDGDYVFQLKPSNADGDIGTAVYSSGSTTVRMLLIANYNSTPAHLLVEGGSLYVNSNISPYFGDKVFQVGRTRNSLRTPVPTVTVTGGLLEIQNSSYDSMLFGDNNGQSRFLISGGTVKGMAMRMGDYSSFEIDCSGAAGSGPGEIKFASSFDLTCSGGTNVHFKVTLDDQGDVSTYVDVATTATLDGSIDLDDTAALAAGNLTPGDYVDVIVAATLANTATLTNAGWHIAGAATGDAPPAGTLRLVCDVPEPATMSLLVLGGVGLLIRRRRK